MRTLVRSLGGFALLLTLLIGTVGPVSAAHNGNSKTDLAGTGDPDAAGQALVNYREGTGTFNGRTTVRNLEPGAAYRFVVRRANGDEFVVCEGTANRQGLFACSGQDLVLTGTGPGFVQAAIETSGGVEVASGAFTPDERRGNCRDADQVGSQCMAPGQTT